MDVCSWGRPSTLGAVVAVLGPTRGGRGLYLTHPKVCVWTWPRPLCPSGDLRPRRVVHLPGPSAAGEPGRGRLPEPPPQHAHRGPAPQDAHQVEGDVGQVGFRLRPLPPFPSPMTFDPCCDPLWAGLTGCWSTAPSPWWGSTPSSPTPTPPSSRRWSTRRSPSATDWRSR